MKKDLEYFTIDGAFGGNQEWFTNVVMNIGGCGAATACDSCIYFAMKRGLRKLYPFDIQHLTKEDYKSFSQIMKPYIRPRVGGVRKLEWYIDGLGGYVRDVNSKYHCDIRIQMEGLSGGSPFETAREAVKSQIDEGYPVPYLMLKHRDSRFRDYVWHWFLLVGYEENQEDLIITAATYGEAERLSLEALWDTGYEEKGGIILYKLRAQHIK